MARHCPKCNAEIPVADEKASFAPFCSERCRLLDLGAWLDGDYKIPGRSVDPLAPEGSSEPSDDEGY